MPLDNTFCILEMEMKLRQGCKYALLVPTSMGLRITPENGQPVQCSDVLHLYATSAETNVASIASYLGMSVYQSRSVGS